MGWSELVNWDRLYKVLRLAARWAAPTALPTFDCGISAEDLVGETLLEFFRSPKRLGWRPPKGDLKTAENVQKSLESFLIVVLKRRTIDHLRRQKHVAGSFDDDQRVPEPSRAETAFLEAEYAATREKIYDLLDGEQDLKDLLAAADLTTGSQNVNQELAQILDKEPEQVVNLKRRLLQYKPGIKELLYGKSRTERKG